MPVAATLPPVRGPMPPGAASPVALRRAAQAFEAQALGALLQPMFQGLNTEAPFGGGAAEGTWRPMLVEAIAKDLAKAGGLGIGEAVLRELTRLAGAPQPASPSATPSLDPETPTP